MKRSPESTTAEPLVFLLPEEHCVSRFLIMDAPVATILGDSAFWNVRVKETQMADRNIQCILTLISSPHLARSYHHLFPIVPFDEVSLSLLIDQQNKFPRSCFGCQQSPLNPGNKPGLLVACPKCKQHFCLECDMYIHESLHNCPGCENTTHSKIPNINEG